LLNVHVAHRRQYQPILWTNGRRPGLPGLEKMGRALADYDLLWMEESIIPEDYVAYRRG